MRDELMYLTLLEVWTDPHEPVFENVGVTFRLLKPDFARVYIESNWREYTSYIEEGPKPPEGILNDLIKIVKNAEDRVWDEMEDDPWNPQHDRRCKYLFHKYLIEEMFSDVLEVKSVE